MNYIVVLFKNKKRKKIIKEFVTFDRANNFFEKYKEKSDSIVFHKEVVNGYESEHELGLIQNGKTPDGFVYLKDDYGRNVRVALEDKNMSVLKMNPIKIEELLYDYQTKQKISLDQVLKKYLRGTGIKLISGLNNKIIIQVDESVNILVTKNEKECERFLDCLTTHFFKIKRADCIIVKDSSTPQRKYLYRLLESKGYDKTFLYRKSTFQHQ
jgi:hypothetical protein